MNEQDLLAVNININYPPDDYSSLRNLGVHVTGTTVAFRPGDIALVKLNLDYGGGGVQFEREIYPQMMDTSFVGTYFYSMLAVSATAVRLNAELWREDPNGNRTFVTAPYVELHDIHA